MVLALSATTIVIAALLWEVALPRIEERLDRHRAGRRKLPADGYDPGRERRAEQRARQLLKSCVNEEEWSMYRDLGFIRVWGGQSTGPGGRATGIGPSRGSARDLRGVPYAYLV